MMTTSRWEDNILLIGWYGGMEEEAADWNPRNNTLVFEGYDETFRRKYEEKPSADIALLDITEWQNGW